jgi:hypothetical protein
MYDTSPSKPVFSWLLRNPKPIKFTLILEPFHGLRSCESYTDSNGLGPFITSPVNLFNSKSESGFRVLDVLAQMLRHNWNDIEWAKINSISGVWIIQVISKIWTCSLWQYLIVDRGFADVHFNTQPCGWRVIFFIKKNQNLNAYYLLGKFLSSCWTELWMQFDWWLPTQLMF